MPLSNIMLRYPSGRNAKSPVVSETGYGLALILSYSYVVPARSVRAVLGSSRQIIAPGWKQPGLTLCSLIYVQVKR